MDEQEDRFRTRTPSDKSLVTLASEHLALLASITGALIFAFRCIIVSEGDPYVASILATQTSIGDAIRALLFTVVPILLFGLSFVAAFAAFKGITVSKGFITRIWREPKALGLLVLSPAAMFGCWFLIGLLQQRGKESGFDRLGAAIGLVTFTTLPLVSLGYLRYLQSR
jgi:hypothetical protein